MGRDGPAAPRRDVSGRLHRQVGKATAPLLAVLAVVVAVAAIEFYAIQKFGRRGTAPRRPPRSRRAPRPRPRARSASSTRLLPSRSGARPWSSRAGRSRRRAFARSRDASTAACSRRRSACRVRTSRRCTRACPTTRTRASTSSGDLAAAPAPAGVDRRPLAIVAIAHDGSETLLGTRSLIEPAAFERWRAFAAADATPFHLLPALSGIALGGAAELDTLYAPYVSPTIRVGMRVPMLYLRTTSGAAHDYAFDPDWDVEHRCPQVPGERRHRRRLAQRRVRATRSTKRLPVLVTLNGGIWARRVLRRAAVGRERQARAGSGELPVEREERGDGRRLPQEPARRFAGGPELARSLTFNVYARDVRRYKKRNLQQAARLHRALRARAPRALRRRQPRPRHLPQPVLRRQGSGTTTTRARCASSAHWLAGTGPYAGARRRACPTCRAYRRAQPLTLADASRLAGRRFASWDEVDPPRAFSHEAKRGRSGSSRGCASGRCSAGTWSTCTTTSWRNGSSRPASRASASGRRRA